MEGRHPMSRPRYRFLFSAFVVLLLAPPLAVIAAPGGHARTGGTAATPSRSGGGSGSGGSAPERRFGGGGGLNRSHGWHSSTHVFVGWPWWGAGWGWGYGGPSYYGYWGGYYPGYGYPAYGYGYGYRSAPPDSAAAAELHISPRKAQVRLDGYDVGQARDYNDSYTPL